MKAKDFGLFLVAFSDIPETYSDTRSARAWHALGAFFSSQAKSTVLTICKTLKAIKPGGAPGCRAAAISAQITEIAKSLSLVSKKSWIDDLNSLKEALDRHPDHSIDAILSAAQTAAPLTSKGRKQLGPDSKQLIDTYLGELERTFRDKEAFAEVFGRLKQDASLKAPTLKALARRFSGETATSKPHALQLIWARHAALMESRAKAAATAGRTAA